MEDEKVALPPWLIVLTLGSLLIAAVSLGLYVWKFGTGFSTSQEVWGQFGDFIGGSLNPLFALTALFALLYTIVLQSAELKRSTKQLEKSASALDNQNLVLKKQSFEATFFQLIQLFNEIISQLGVTNRGNTKIGERQNNNSGHP